MLDRADFETLVARANLAPSIHNAQPARWRQVGDTIEIGADRRVQLPQADPTGAHIGLSCGAAVEATVLALSALGYACEVTDLWHTQDLHSWSGHRLAARLALHPTEQVDRLHTYLETRFTWRSAFAPDAPQLFGWTRSDTAFVFDAPTRQWIADLNDVASLKILRGKPFRRELLSWMRLDPDHPRYHLDGLSRAALQIAPHIAGKVASGFGPLWGVLELIGKTRAMTAEAEVTMTAPILACFHRPSDESPVTSGRAYLRLCLEASHLGLAGWPMAALSDDAQTATQITRQLAIPPDRKLIQVLRFGAPTRAQTPRARHPASALIDG